MAREVFVCQKCGEQGAEQWGFCHNCGPTQVMCLDDWARAKEREVEIQQLEDLYNNSPDQ
jgi:predicted ATP-dependent serine protease